MEVLEPSTEQCRKCKLHERANLIKEVMAMKESLDYSKTVPANFYYVVINLILHTLKQQPRIDRTERKYVKFLRRQNLSIGEIAWILNRSKSTIHESLMKTRNQIKTLKSRKTHTHCA